MRAQLAVTLAASALALSLAACAASRGAAAATPAAPAAAPIRDRDLGLSRTSVFEAPAPPAWKAEASAPGEKSPPPPRIGPQIPPVIPHAVADALPITREANACVDCHAIPGPKKAGEPTPLPASHYVDDRHAPDKVADRVAGARWICILCHVPRTDAPPAVANGYRP